MATFTKAERKLIDRYKAMHRFRVAHTEKEYNEAVSYAKAYCEKYKLKYNRIFSGYEFSHYEYKSSID